MRAPSDLPRSAPGPRPPGRGRVLLVIAVSALFVLVTSLRGIARVYTDFLWFDSVGYTSVWTGVLSTKIWLGAIFTTVFFVLMLVNLWIADRSAPPFRPHGPEEEMLERYHEIVGPRRAKVRVAVAAFFALVAGAGMSAAWNEWLLFANGVEFGVEDPQFGKDLGFYVFQLPFLSQVVDWAFASLVIVLSVTAAAHYLNGGIRMQAPFQRVLPQVKAHLSFLLAALALVKVADYYLSRFELTTSTRGVVDGATYTDVSAQLPAIGLLMWIAALACVLFIYNIVRKGWVLPAIVVGLWALVQVIVLGIVPAMVQRFSVIPDESSRERPYIVENISATRAALGLQDVVTESFAYTEDRAATGQALVENEVTVRNIRLVDPTIAVDTYRQLQAAVGFWRFPDELDVDRYTIDGEPTQVVLAARGLDLNGLPQKSWEGMRVRFTHGYGLAMSPANATTSTGRPDFRIRDAPIVTRGVDAPIQDPQIYVGEGLGGYAIVSTSREEVDYVDNENNTISTRYEGEAGVPIGSFMRRFAFALRFGEIEPVISGLMRSDSEIIYMRDARERVAALAPFLHIDSDPYPVIVDGRILYVVDAYTTSSRYPYAQRAANEGLPSDSGLNHTFNYVRNSVKATVDTYDGAVTLYVLPDEMSGGDPIVEAYRKAFPTLFTDYDEIPDTLRDHLRYPEDLFRVQTGMWGRYHIDDPESFYSPATGWAVAQDPGADVEGGRATVVTNDRGEEVGTREGRISPNYQLLRLPNSDEENFVILRPFVPVSENDERKQLTAFMTATGDEEGYGELRVFELPPNTANGPAIVSSNIRSNTTVSAELTLLGQQGSKARFGDQQLVPIGNSILYVRPLYVQAEGETAVPELRKVIVVFGDQVVMENTLKEALERIFDVDVNTREAPRRDGDSGETPDPDPDSDPDSTTTTTETPTTTAPDTTVPGDVTVDNLLRRAEELFVEADAAFADGDLVTWAEKVTEARALVAQASGLLAGTTTTTAPPAEPVTTATVQRTATRLSLSMLRR